MENLISSLKSHEIELIRDELVKKSKSISLTYKGKYSKVLQVVELEEETHDGGSDNGSDLKEMAYLTKRFHYPTKNKRFPSRSNDSKGSGFKNKKEDQKGCFNCKKLDHLLLTV